MTRHQPCVCSHGIAAHDLNTKGIRTVCSVHHGPRGEACGCRLYKPQGDQ